jgi:phosphoribosylformylglycinamidine synthase
VGNQAPDVDEALDLKRFFTAIQSLNSKDKLIAYHDRSDGGLFSTLVEMAFAGHCGLDIDLDGLAGDAASALYNEELGAVIQVRASEADAIVLSLKQELPNCVHMLGKVTISEGILIKQAGKSLFKASRVDLHRAWSETTYQMQKMRDNPDCAQQEYDRILDKADVGLHAKLTFDPSENIACTIHSNMRSSQNGDFA